jgi:hypothetical protein
VVDEGVGERHAHGAGTYHQVVRIDHAGHASTKAPAPTPVQSSAPRESGKSVLLSTGT